MRHPRPLQEAPLQANTQCHINASTKEKTQLNRAHRHIHQREPYPSRTPPKTSSHYFRDIKRSCFY